MQRTNEDNYEDFFFKVLLIFIIFSFNLMENNHEMIRKHSSLL